MTTPPQITGGVETHLGDTPVKYGDLPKIFAWGVPFVGIIVALAIWGLTNYVDYHIEVAVNNSAREAEKKTLEYVDRWYQPSRPDGHPETSRTLSKPLP